MNSQTGGFGTSESDPSESGVPNEGRSTPSETVERMLSSYRLGEKLRGLRLKRKISLVDLGKLTGFSPSMLSQLENGKLIPTLATLSRVALVFETGLDFFFAAQPQSRPFVVIRATDRSRPVAPEGSRDPADFLEGLPYSNPENSVQVWAASFPPRLDSTDPHFHHGTEFVYIISGKLEIRRGAESHVLEPGDCCRFDSSEPHSYRSASDGPAEAFVITSLPKWQY